MKTKINRNFSGLIIMVLGLSTNLVAANKTDNIAFSDPDQMAKVADGFVDQKINYGEKVGDVDLVITLGQQTYPALHKIVERMAKDRGIKIDIQKGSCGSTARKLLKKKVDIGVYCCPPGRSDRLPGLVFHTVGIAPIHLVTNVKNPVKNITTSDARKIFMGEYVAWSEVPGIGNSNNPFIKKDIQPVARLHCKKRYGHWRALLRSADDFSPKLMESSVIPDMIKNVADHDGAIGYETSYMLKVHKKKGVLKSINIDGKDPTNLQHLLKGDYPIYRTYNMTTWEDPLNKKAVALELVKDLTKYIEENGHAIDFIPASQLRKAGWKFKNDELVGQPDGLPVITEHM